MRVDKLVTALIDKGISKKDFASQIGMDESTLYRKMQKNGSGFTIREASKMIEVLDLDNVKAADIFFNEKLADTQVIQ